MIITIIILLRVFQTTALTDALLLDLNNSKSLQVSRTFLSILADFSNAVV